MLGVQLALVAQASKLPAIPVSQHAAGATPVLTPVLQASLLLALPVDHHEYVPGAVPEQPHALHDADWAVPLGRK